VTTRPRRAGIPDQTGQTLIRFAVIHVCKQREKQNAFACNGSEI
jgi:hypothetical protein